MQVGGGPTGLALAAFLIVCAVSTAGPAAAQQARFCGVVRFTGRTCVTVPGNLGSAGRVFDISDITPRPGRNATISGSGTVRGISHCARATNRLAHVSWRRVTVCPETR